MERQNALFSLSCFIYQIPIYFITIPYRWGYLFSTGKQFSPKCVDNLRKTVDKCGMLWRNVGFANNWPEIESPSTPHIWGDSQILTCILNIADEKRNQLKQASQLFHNRTRISCFIHIWGADRNLRFFPHLWGCGAQILYPWGVKPPIKKLSTVSTGPTDITNPLLLTI